LIDIHSELKVQIYKDEDGQYKAFRDDSVEAVVPLYNIMDKRMG